MQEAALSGLSVARVRTDADVEDMVAVRTQADPEHPPRFDNLRHNLDSDPELRYLIARLDGAPVGCGFVEPAPAEFARAHVVVVPDARRRGVGSALLSQASKRARELGKTELQGEVVENDAESRAYLERRGFWIDGGEQAVALDLTSFQPPAVEPPDGIEIVSRAERPDVVERMYAVSLDAERDIPGFAGDRSFEAFRAQDVDRPSVRPELTFVALAGDEVVGYAALHAFGADAHHGLTAVKRAWRRRGVATALKRAQMAAAKDAGFRRLVTESETRNVPMRTLNEQLGYRPEPSLSTVVLRGPLL
jgi:GNAT superfamily N-acetyltransferase